MAEMVQNEEGDSGILQPVLMHKWLLDTSLPDDYNHLLRMQVVRCSINLVKRIFKLEVEQPKGVGARMFGVMELLTRGATGFTLRSPNGNDTAEDLVHITAELIDHKYDLDYAGPSEVSLHKLEFKF